MRPALLIEQWSGSFRLTIFESVQNEYYNILVNPPYMGHDFIRVSRAISTISGEDQIAVMALAPDGHVEFILTTYDQDDREPVTVSQYITRRMNYSLET